MSSLETIPVIHPSEDTTASPSGPADAVRTTSDQPGSCRWQRQGNWLQIERAPSAEEDATVSPGGLWQRFVSGEYRFDVPWEAVEEMEQAGLLLEGMDPVVPFLDWAQAAWLGKNPEHWKAPDRDLVQTWFPQDSRTCKVGLEVLPVHHCLEPSAWHLGVPLVIRSKATLDESRERWLEAFLQAEQSQWRLVRLVRGESGPGLELEARVDLAGAPASQILFQASLEALHYVAQHMAETVQVLTDGTIPLRTLNWHPPSAT